MLSDFATGVAAVAFAVLAVFTAIFQLAMAGGAPWGHLTWGGRYAGRLPPTMRVVALASAVLLAIFALVVLIRAGLLLPGWYSASGAGIWVVVGYSVIGTLANAATPSAAERRLWLPVATGMLVSSVIVALSV